MIIYTDGSVYLHLRRGGWAARIEREGRAEVRSGGADTVSNARMELQAVVEGLESLPEPCRVEVHTDCQRVLAFLAGGKPCRRDGDLWERLHAQMGRHIEVVPVKAEDCLRHRFAHYESRCAAVSEPTNTGRGR